MLAVVEHCVRLAALPVGIAAPAPSSIETDISWSTSTHTTVGKETAMTEEKNRKDAYRRVAELLERHLSQSHGITAPVLAELRRIQRQMAAAGRVPPTVNTEVAQPD